MKMFQTGVKLTETAERTIFTLPGTFNYLLPLFAFPGTFNYLLSLFAFPGTFVTLHLFTLSGAFVMIKVLTRYRCS